MEYNIKKLLESPLFQLTGDQFVALAHYAHANAEAQTPAAPTQAIGLSDLADALHCSISQVAVMRRDGVLDDAIISRIGRHIVFDVDRAREAANEWQERRKPTKRRTS